MFSKSKVKKVDFVTLSKFYGKYKEALQLELINSPAGLSRHICEPALHRPGLAIAGFYSYFANKRIQVFGSAELAYLQKLPEGMRKSRIQRMFRCEVPGIVFSRDKIPPREIVELADEAGVCVFRTSLVTMKFVNSCKTNSRKPPPCTAASWTCAAWASSSAARAAWGRVKRPWA